MSPPKKIRVLIVDDSAVVRKVLARALSNTPDIEVAGQAEDAWTARDALMRLNPDVVTLDVEMPRMDGLTFLKKIMHYRPMPVIIISSLTQAHSVTTLEALAAGAFDVVEKPSSPEHLATLPQRLADCVRAAVESSTRLANAAASATAAAEPHAPTGARPELIAIGASTGGTIAIEKIVCRPGKEPDMPPVVIAQHMPGGFTRAYADRVDKLSNLTVREAVDGEPLHNNLVLIAPGGKHLTIRREGRELRACVNTGPLVNGHAPSVDVLLRSVAAVSGSRAFGALLTGMGRDGAEGLLAMRKAGATTVAQDEASCVVYGMPKAAVEIEAATAVWSLERIAQRVRAFGETHSSRSSATLRNPNASNA